MPYNWPARSSKRRISSMSAYIFLRASELLRAGLAEDFSCFSVRFAGSLMRRGALSAGAKRRGLCFWQGPGTLASVYNFVALQTDEQCSVASPALAQMRLLLTICSA